MPTPTIPNGEEHFFPIIYSGNGQAQRVGKFVPFTDNGTIAKSCMFNRTDNPRLARTPSSAGNRKTWTFSVWIKRAALGSARNLILTTSPSGGTAGEFLMFHTDNTIKFTDATSSYYNLTTNRTFEDTSKWYHLLIAADTTQATAANRIKMYIDGDQITSFSTETYPSQDFQFEVNNTSNPMNLGGDYGSSGSENASYYFAEVNIVDGTALTPSTFGVTNTSTMRWIPKTLTGITYGTNGFRLQFGTDSALGDDTSGNTNDFTSSGLAASDQRTDTPTNNLPTMRPYNPSYNTTQAQGNLQYTPTGTNAGYPMCATLRPNSGKWYAEVRTSSNGGGNVITFGIYIQEDMHHWDNSYNYYPGGQISNGDGNGVGMQIRNDGNRWLTSSQLNGTVQNNLTGVALAAGDVIGIAVDVDNSLVTWYANDGSSLGSASILRPGRIMFTAMAVTSSDTFNWNFGDNPTFDGNETAGGNADGDGNGNFYHSVPTGFKMLRQDNMPETDKGITGFTWMKDRDSGSLNHAIYDSSRGANKLLYPNTTSAELSVTSGVSKFLKGGYAVGDASTSNNAGDSFVAWNWVANSGTTSSNGDGSGTSTVQVNSTSKFSIVQYNGTGSDQTIGHGLSVKPDTIWVKCVTENSATGSGVSWRIWQKDVISLSGDANSYLRFDSDDSHTAVGDSWGDTAPTSSVFTVGADVHTNASVSGGTAQYIAYCFANVDGYFKTGKYAGNNSADGPFIYTGFKPAFVMMKGYNIGTPWIIWDNKRSLINPCDNVLYPNITDVEATAGNDLDILSNGFKCRGTAQDYNSTYDYLYFAWAEHPFVGDGTSPVTAR